MGRMVSRALMVAGAAGLALAPGLASPVFAAPDLDGSGSADVAWKSPAEDEVSGPVTIRATVTLPDHAPVAGWTVEVPAPPGEDHPGFGILCDQQPGAAGEVECPWDSTVLPDGSPSRNGDYLIRITAWTSARGGSPAQRYQAPDRPVTVVNRATPPRHVTLTQEGPGTVTVAWAANPEPDVDHYIVERQAGKDHWAEVGQPPGNLFEDAVRRPGTYGYRVAAVRKRPVEGHRPTPLQEPRRPRPRRGARLAARPGRRGEAAGAGGRGVRAEPGAGQPRLRHPP